MWDQESLRSACAYAQSDQSRCLSLEYYISVKLMTEHHLEFLSLKGGCTGSSESILVQMPHCWKSHVMLKYNSPEKPSFKSKKTLKFNTNNIMNVNSYTGLQRERKWIKIDKPFVYRQPHRFR